MEIKLILAAFAIYRVSQFITIDDGPADIFVKLRTLFGVYDLGPNGRPKTSLGKLFECSYCIGVWVAVPFGIWALFPIPVTWSGAILPISVCVTVLALAGMQAFLESICGNDRPK